MPRGRHSLETRTVRGPKRLRRPALLAVVTTALVVGLGVVVSGASVPSRLPSRLPSHSASASLVDGGTRVSESIADAREARSARISRSTERSPLPRAVPRATAKLWTTASLDLRTLPKEHTRKVGQLKDVQHVPVTGRRQSGYAEVIVNGAARWVTAQYLSKTKVVDPADRGISGAPCPDGSGIEGGLQPQSVKVYRAVCAAFPELSSYGGQDGHGEHVNGEAIDFMVPSSSVGEQVKDFLYAHHSELDLFDIIWSQHIWTIERSGEGFRSMSDRGSATANHYDHVHIKINY